MFHLIIDNGLNFFNGSIIVALESTAHFQVKVRCKCILALPYLVAVVTDVIVPVACILLSVEVDCVPNDSFFSIKVDARRIYFQPLYS